ncbi:MAG: hypothetical protein WDO74_37510 [Pseudomonadota bacterium]
MTRAGAHLGLSVTVLPFLEAFAGFHNYATSNSRGRPQLLQVLGDTNIGVKGFTPHTPNGIFSFGGEVELWLLNGTGGVGLDSASTSFALRGLATADLNNRSRVEDRIPLRFHANVGYLFDNAGKIVSTVENTPAAGRSRRTDLAHRALRPRHRSRRFFQAGLRCRVRTRIRAALRRVVSGCAGQPPGLHLRGA